MPSSVEDLVQVHPIRDVDDDSAEASSNESDYLDNIDSRKRRRMVATINDNSRADADGDEEEENVNFKAVLSSMKAPSRIKAKAQSQSTTGKAKPSLNALGQTQIAAPTDPNTTFSALNLRPWLVQSLANMAISRPTGIQKGCIPEILRGRDCIGGSRTGSGKTVAFAAPILQKWAEDQAQSSPWS